jgi:hypothetical protein
MKNAASRKGCWPKTVDKSFKKQLITQNMIEI